MKLYIRGFSRNQDYEYDKIADMSDQIDEHIIRLLIFPHNFYEEHWMKEIWKFLYRVHKLKGKNKYPSKKFIFDALSGNMDIIENLIPAVKTKENNLTPEDAKLEDILYVADGYHKWLSERLSTKGAVLVEDVIEILTKLTSDVLDK